MDQTLHLRLDQGETRSVKTERGIRQICCLSQIVFNLYSEHLPKGALEEFGGFKTEQVVSTVKYTDNLVLLVKEEKLLQGMIGRLMETARCCGMKMWEKTGNENLKTTIYRTDCDRTETTVECGIYQLFG